MVRFPAGVAVLFCVAWAGPASAQYRPPGLPPDAPYIAPPQVPQVPIPPIEAPPPPDIDWQERIRQWHEDEDRRNEALAQFTKYAGPAHDPASDYPKREEMIAYLEFLLAVVGVIVAVWAALRACVWLARPTDPTKHILNDPWVQAHLSRQGAPPPEQPN
jgi:hypothetical protein